LDEPINVKSVKSQFTKSYYTRWRTKNDDSDKLKTFGSNLQTMFFGYGVKLQILQRNHQQPNKWEWSRNTTTQKDISYLCILFYYAVL